MKTDKRCFALNALLLTILLSWSQVAGAMIFTLPQEAKPNGPSKKRQGIEINGGLAPHQITFSTNGKEAIVAAAGSNQLTVIDATTKKVLRKFAVGKTPLGVLALDGTDNFLVSRFAGEEIVVIDGDQGVRESITVGSHPSLFSEQFAASLVLVSSEEANQCSIIDTKTLKKLKSYPTGKRPFPGAATSDGRLAFIPNYDDGTVTVIDLWNELVVDTVQVGENPSGATMMPGDIEVAIVLRGEDTVKFINTASHRVTHTLKKGLGKSPFSLVLSQDRKRVFVNNTKSHDISVFAYPSLQSLGRIRVGEIPIAMSCSPSGEELWMSCEGSHRVHVLPLPLFKTKRIASAAQDRKKSKVLVLGMIHGSHRKSKLWGLSQVEQTIRKFKPDVVLCEIPPDRWQRIWQDYSVRTALDDSRIKPFPEYTDVLLPLKLTMGFDIEPCAAWTQEMALLRRNRMKAFRTDPKKTEDWQKYQAEEKSISKRHKESPIVQDDPLVIHSGLYDARTKEELGPYDHYMNDYIGAGGWTNINQGHYDLIAAALAKHAGKRILITFGAGHKYWFLEQLRKHPGVTLLDAISFLPKR